MVIILGDTAMPGGLQTVWSSIGIKQVNASYLNSRSNTTTEEILTNEQMFAQKCCKFLFVCFFHWYCFTSIHLKVYIYILSNPVSLWVELKSFLVTAGVMQIHKHNSDKWMERARDKETVADIYCSAHTGNNASACLWYTGRLERNYKNVCPLSCLTFYISSGT